MGAKCKGCGADIIWIRTAAGKALPCDAPLVMYRAVKHGRERVVTADGAVIACEIVESAGQATGVGHIAHWATCPAAKTFRKGGRK